MKRFQEYLYRLHPYLLSCIAGTLTVAQIVLVFFLRGPGIEVLEWAGWICLWTSSNTYSYSSPGGSDRNKRLSMVPATVLRHVSLSP